MRLALALWACVLAVPLAAQESFEAEFRRGLLALNGNALAQARQSLEDASRLKPDNALVWAALAQTYLRSREIKQANEAARRAAVLAPSDPAAERALALFYSETGDFAEAAAWERRFASSPAAARSVRANAISAASVSGGLASEAPSSLTVTAIQPSQRAARRRAPGFPPPTQMGGRGCCTGRGPTG